MSVLQTLEGHNGTVRAVTALPDGQRAFSASEDGTLKLWDLSAGTEVQTFRGHESLRDCSSRSCPTGSGRSRAVKMER